MATPPLRQREDAGVDYRALRKALQDLRFERRMTVTELADEAGVAKSTVYRLEEIEDVPDREIDLETLEKLAGALTITLSAFFARIEGLRPEGPGGDTLPSNPAPEQKANHGAPVPASDRVVPPLPPAYAAVIGAAIVDGIDRAVERLLTAREQAATAGRNSPARADDSRKVGR